MTGVYHPAGFACVWDPTGDIRQRCRPWAEQRGGTQLLGIPPVSVFGFAADTEAPQPWSDSRASGVFLGEFYQLETMRADLAAAGMEVAAEPATLIPAGYVAWGAGLFARLEGLFSVVLWDHRQQTLVLYRDGSCARALYWHQGDGWAACATRLDLLASMPGVSKGIAPAGLHEYLRFLDVSPPHTIHAGISALEPGLPAHFDGVALRYARQPPVAIPPVAPPRLSATETPPFESCVTELDDALRASVAARLNREGPTGVFLSGGVDSTLLCAIAASFDPRAVEAFTVGFQEHGFDETPVAAEIAAHLGVRHHRLIYDQAAYVKGFEALVAGADLPFADPAAVPTLLLFQDCRQVVTAALDGTGADTLVGVMPARYIRIATQYAARLPRALRRAGGALLRRLPGLAAYAKMLEFDAPEDLLIRWKGWSRAEIESLRGAEVRFDHTRFFTIYRQFGHGDHLPRYSALLGNLPDDRIHQAVELTGLRVRFPYWDATVERLIRRLPLSYRYSDAQPKRLLRALLARYLPRSLWDLPKHGFDFPFIPFLQYDDHALVRRYLDPGLLDRHGLVQPEMVGRYTRAFRDGDLGLGFRIWALVVLFAWLEHHYAQI